jgi:hypothetical protein
MARTKRMSSVLESAQTRLAALSSAEAAFLGATIPGLAIAADDKLELTNWDGKNHLKVNGKFIET